MMISVYYYKTGLSLSVSNVNNYQLNLFSGWIVLSILLVNFLWIFKVAQKSGPSPCTIVQGLWPNFVKNG